MNCQERQAELIELARSGSPRHPALAGHLEVCVECSRFLDRQLALKSAFTSLVAKTASAPEDLEAKVLAEFDAAARTSPWQVRWFPARAAALAAALVAVALLIGRRLSGNLPRCSCAFLTWRRWRPTSEPRWCA